MDCNGRSLLPWDWEDLIMLNASETESHGQLKPAGLEIGKHEATRPVSSWISGIGGISCTGFDMEHVGSPNGSQSTSTSVNFSPVEEKRPQLTFEMIEPIGDFGLNKNSSKTRVADAISVFPTDSFLSLKLGKRIFEDTSEGINDEGSSVSMNFSSYADTGKRSRSYSPSIQPPRCQVEGCNLDLSTAKDYHRKHRVCENHSKCPKVIVGGLERRFCQQCSRFHGLCEFDEKKRSCRKRLSNHNARRRKQAPEAFHFNMARSCERKSQMGVVRNCISREGGYGAKPSKPPEFALKPNQIDEVDWRLIIDAKRIACSTPPMYSSSAYLPSNRVSTSTDGTNNFHRALSLLSTASLDTCQPKHVSLYQPINNPQPSQNPIIGFGSLSSTYLPDC